MIKKLAMQLSDISKITRTTILTVIILLIGIEAILIPITKSKAWLNRPLTSLNLADEYYPVPPSYVDAVWFEDYRKEFKAAVTFDWQPYLYWHTKPFVGRYINVNEDRTRKTDLFMAKITSPKKKKKIFMFGGSTMWGWGVRDAYTIPS